MLSIPMFPGILKSIGHAIFSPVKLGTCVVRSLGGMIVRVVFFHFARRKTHTLAQISLFCDLNSRKKLDSWQHAHITHKGEEHSEPDLIEASSIHLNPPITDSSPSPESF